jgi:uncharacterized membrane protein (Fun14 family)
MGFVRWLLRSLSQLVVNPIVLVILLVVVLVIIGVLWVNQDSIRQAASESVPAEVSFHAYMIGLFIPEGFLIGLIWNPGLRRYVSPVSGRMISGGLGIALSVVFAAIGYLVFRPWLESGLTMTFNGWASGPLPSVLTYWIYAAFSAVLLPFLMLSLASPAGALRGLKWLARAIW